MGKFIKVNYSKAIEKCLGDVKRLTTQMIDNKDRRMVVLRAINRMERARQLTEEAMVEVMCKPTDPKFYKVYKDTLMDKTEKMIQNGEKLEAKEIRRIISGILDKFIANENNIAKAEEIFLKPENHKGGLKEEKTYPIRINHYVTESGALDYHKILTDLIEGIEDTKVKLFLVSALSRFSHGDRNPKEYVYAKEFCEVEMEVSKDLLNEQEGKNVRRIISQVLQPKIKKFQQQHQYNKAKANRLAKREAKKAKKNK